MPNTLPEISKEIHSEDLSPDIHLDIDPAPMPIIISSLIRFFLKYTLNSISLFIKIQLFVS